jgi:glycosyltransferase involved in cell wall biosynthesis
LLSNDYTILLVGLSEKQRKTLPCGIIGINKTEDILELSSIYASADIFVNPTYEDSFPTTNLEALACGTPVITYNTGGSTESITPGTGFVVEQGDIQGLLKSIKEIISKGRRYYSPICRDHALNFFNKEERYLEYLRLYEELINKN